jgi:hypothetical protein
MATDRDEQLRQQQELEEIRRSFAEMGARMGSLFEPTETEPVEPPSPPPATPPPAPAPRPRWWALVALVAVFLVGGVIGYALNRGGADASTSPSQAPTVITGAPGPAPAAPGAPRTRTSVPEICLRAAELGDEVIARLIDDKRDNRLSTTLKEYTVANQACREEASS